MPAAASPYKALSFEMRGRVALIQLTRPERRNAFSMDLKADFAALMPELRNRSDIAAMVLTGSGGVFSAGGDMESWKNDPGEPLPNRRKVKAAHDWFRPLADMECPVIAAVDGPAYGGGFALALAADFVYATPRARFCCAYVRMGLVPDVGVYETLPRLVGARVAKDLILTGRSVGAEEAVSLGLVNTVLPEEGFLEAVLETAARFEKASTFALGAAKSVLNQSYNLDSRALIEMEVALEALCLDSAYHRAARDRFLAKQPAEFDWDRMDAAAKKG
ncbi:MAG: enoyl-CoA hydratase/isomerase family protein [Hyphomonadaceae bacterium]|nr:enoyl-CoA hydratase/isomerase family protein [Hyphomonadaceae bacterium]